MTHEGHGVMIFLRENLWAEDRQFVYYLKYNPGLDVDCILWRINSWWIRDYSGLLITRNPHFYTTRNVCKESWLKSTAEWSVRPQPLQQVVLLNDKFVMYIEKLPCLWLTDTKQRFGNICRLGERGSYLVKDAHGVLHNSVGLGRPFEGEKLYVVRREGGQDKPPVRNTWKQLLDEWDATDSETKFIVTLPQAPDSRVPPPAGTPQKSATSDSLHVSTPLLPYPTPPVTPQPPTALSASGSGAGETTPPTEIKLPSPN
ncbi:hypothetical protein DFH09DRAFT_1313903 [Mycena vulgaris]|nr:hypothetical protein DFH09DRAFT_1313903 [Mycena vulgaris]